MGEWPMGCLQDCAAFRHLAATFTREVEAGHLSFCHILTLGCHLHERGRGWPQFNYRGADDLKPTLVACMSRGYEARIWSGHHPQNDLCLARLRSAPRLCTLTSPRRWAYVPEPLSSCLCVAIGLRRASALPGCHLHERGRGRSPYEQSWRIRHALNRSAKSAQESRV